MDGEVKDDELPWNFGYLSRAAELRLRMRYGYGDLDRQQRLIDRDLRNARDSATKRAAPSTERPEGSDIDITGREG